MGELVTLEEQKFYDFMIERHKIFYKRFILKEESPYTEDPILSSYKYTNVYRELDRNTVYYKINVVDSNMDLKHKIWNTIFFRLVNNPDFFESVGFFRGSHSDLNDYYEILVEEELRRKKEGKLVFTNAYMIRPAGEGITKMQGYVKNVFPEFIKRTYPIIDTIKTGDWQRNIKLVSEVTTVGDFIAYELYCDFCMLSKSKLSLNDYVNPGPGAKLGLKRIYDSVGNKKNQIKLIRSLQSRFVSYVSSSNKEFYFIEDISKDSFNLRSIEHSLCEYHKYRTQLKAFEEKSPQRKRIKFSPKKPKEDYLTIFYNSIKFYVNV